MSHKNVEIVQRLYALWCPPRPAAPTARWLSVQERHAHVRADARRGVLKVARPRDGFEVPVAAPVVGRPPGRQNRPRPFRVTFERVAMDPHAGWELFWDRNGNVFDDEELTRPTGLTIVRLRGGRDG